ncbi:MAG: T9SS type A sorting domain-containing protein [Mariniphaga sp.]|nr:T9SS type A sorting domain-containing protein [Mariniphaga sp.]
MIFTLAMLFNIINAQIATWPKKYWNYKVTYNYDLIETYDKGYIVLNTIRPDGITAIWAWLVKTDINGEILWEKFIGDGLHTGGFQNIHQTYDGGYVLGGGTYMLDYLADPMFMKLNACGEKDWCRIFYQAGPNTAYCTGLNIYPVPDEDGYIALVTSWGNEFVPGSGVYKGIWLFRLDNSGNLIWIKNVFDQVDPNAWNEYPYHMFISQDTLCIITGNTIYNDYGGELGYDKPFIMAAGIDGSEKWWVIDGANTMYRGDDQQSSEDNDGNILTVGVGWYTGSGNYPMLIKTSKTGSPIYRKYLINSTEFGAALCINVMNDTIYDIGGGWNYPGQPYHSVIARTDTSGNLLLEKNIVESNFGLNQSIVTFDNKELFVGAFKDNDGFYKVGLHKFNFDLEYDTAYTQPFEYDYKCSNLPIVSDTIGIDDCDVWTALPGEIEYEAAQKLIISPNPAGNEITVQLPFATVDEHPWGPSTSRQYNFRYHEQSVLKIFDITGKEMNEIPLKYSEGEKVKVDISGYKAGMYLVNLLENQKQMASGKFVKQ